MAPNFKIVKETNSEGVDEFVVKDSADNPVYVGKDIDDASQFVDSYEVDNGTTL